MSKIFMDGDFNDSYGGRMRRCKPGSKLKGNKYSAMGDLGLEREEMPLNQSKSVLEGERVWIDARKRLPKQSGRYVIAYKNDPVSKLKLFICDYDAAQKKWIAMYLYPVEIVYWMKVDLPK